MNIESIAGVAVITGDPPASHALYVEALGLPLAHADGDDYYHSEAIPGSNHFGVWPLQQAAQACFGSDSWPTEHAVPQASVEFEVPNVDEVSGAASELRDRGFALLHDARKEPWGQTVARLLSPEGVIIGISYAPWAHTSA